MKLQRLLSVLLVAVAIASVHSQNDDDILTAEDNDNLTPDNPPEQFDDNLEGSGKGVIEEPLENVTENTTPQEIEPMETATAPAVDGPACPDVCSCSTEGEGDSISFTVNCADKGLVELPTNIDPQTTKLFLQRNALTTIPRTLSELKNLQELNVNDNSVAEISPGSVSELPELKVLKLANNRLIEYPQDLRNGLSLRNLQEIELYGNDMRSPLSVADFSNFEVLRKVILPQIGKDVSELLCDSHKDALETVCIESCESYSIDCPEAPQNIGTEFLEAKLPGTIALSNIFIETTNTTETAVITDQTTLVSPSDESTDFLLRSAVSSDKVEDTKENIAISNRIMQPNAAGAPIDTPTETDIKVGAATTELKGGVDKGIIGIVVAGMVLIVAGITIKKNWSSMRKRFSSSPRPATGANGNGAVPEEVPLQEKDKSPV